MASEANLKAVIEPSEILIWEGQAVDFVLTVNKKRVPAKWSVSPSVVGKIDAATGRFKAVAGELRYGVATVTGVATIDGKTLKATALIRFMMGIGLMHNSIYFADDFLKIPTISWNNPVGRRAAKLIIDAVEQLPKEFLEKVGTVALVRADWADPPTSGVHLPLPGRIVVLSEYMFQALVVNGSLPPKITENDRNFVRNFIHEISHVILANDGLNDFARWSLICAAAAGLAGGIYLGIQGGGAAAAIAAGWGAVPVVAGTTGVVAGLLVGTVVVTLDFGLLLLWYYGNPLRQEDLAYRFSKTMGWRIRDPNFLTNIWGGGKVPPNVITGFRFIGGAVGLHNEYAPPEGAAIAEWRKAGFYDDYSGTDVHEHFAEVVAIVGMNSPKLQRLLAHALFLEAKKILAEENILPESWSGIDVGKTALAYSRSLGKEANFEAFGVFLGLYAGGAPKKSNKATVKPPPKAKISGGASADSGLETFDAGSDEISTGSADDSEKGLFAEGYGERWDEDEVASAQELVQQLSDVGKAARKFQAETAPVLETVRKTIENLPFPIREGSLLELLRSAECHGIGLQRIDSGDSKGVPPPIIENGVQTGDMLVDKRNNLWIVSRVEKGLATEIVGAPRFNEDGKVEKGFDPADLIFYWRPSVVPRAWFEGQTAAAAEEFVNIVRLWGLEMTPDEEYSLYRPGSFIKVVLGAFGKRMKDLAGKDDEEVLEYSAARGCLPVRKTGMEARLRDVVRLSGGRWALVLRSNPLDLIVQGGGGGEINEEENAAKILHAVNPEKITHIWRWAQPSP